ncbi:MAG: ABC transporter permease [Ruminococcaceae bacterium]|nr:ABC transporter permease [Oscillospiraceae bacterium]
MHRYIIKRLLFLIPTVLGVTLIIFAVMSLTPGNPGRMILGPNATAAEVEEMNQELGYYDPVLVRWGRYVINVFTKGDFGQSFSTKLGVVEELWPRFLITLRLAIIILTISVCIGVPLGILSAVKQNTLMDTIPSMIAFFLAAVPSFVVGITLMFVFSLQLNLLPSFGLSSVRHYILPIMSVVICEVTAYLRFTKSSMLESIRQDYVRTARAKGVAEKTVIWRHALKNALLPVVTSIGMRFGALLAGMVTTEQLFSIPGVGSMIVESISMKDEPAVIGCAVMVSICFTLLMIGVDLIYAFIDPRIRAKYSKRR